MRMAPRVGDGPRIWRPFVACKTPGRGPTAWCRRGIADLTFWWPGGRSLGCYNPRRKRGSKRSWSLHACGRAIDWAPRDEEQGWQIVAGILHAWPSVQRIIYRRVQWYADGRGWRPYGGYDHMDHIHVESNSAA